MTHADPRNAQTKKKPTVSFTLMAVALPLLVTPVSHFIASKNHSSHRVHPVLQQKQPDLPAAMQEKTRQLNDGTWVREVFDEKGRRVSKTLLTAGAEVMSRWHFDPAHEGRIVRYEVHDFKEGKPAGYRVASWKYLPEGGFVKKNQFFDAAGRKGKFFMEFVNEEDIKFREDWYDAQGRTTAEKRWDPETGDFISYFMVESIAKGWSKRIYINAHGQAVREILFTPKGKPFKIGPVQL